MPRCLRCDRGLSSHPEGAQARRGSRTMCVDCVRAAGEPAGPRRIPGVTDGRGDELAAATCRQVDPELWWSLQTSGNHTKAKNLCAECPVRQLCLDQALACGEESGIWGGFDMAHERDAARDWANRMAVTAC